jgi:hypothetical protein
MKVKIKPNEFYTIGDVIDDNDYYIIEIQNACTTDASAIVKRMYTDNINFVIQTIESEILEQLCSDEPYKINADDYDFDVRPNRFSFFAMCDGDHRNDNYFSIEVFNVGKGDAKKFRTLQDKFKQ